MQYIIGTTANSERLGRTKIRSILLSAGAANSVLVVHPYGLTTSDNDIIVNATAGTTIQVNFDGLLFDSGVIVDPDANTTKYIVEYEG